jgi:hypothetical protein
MVDLRGIVGEGGFVAGEEIELLCVVHGCVAGCGEGVDAGW